MSPIQRSWQKDSIGRFHRWDGLSIVERFWLRVQKSQGCWEWQGCVSKTTGYGRMRFENRDHLTHRLSYELHRGPIPKGLSILHACDNRRCVNPAHLFAGTQGDNVADMIAKGRLRTRSRRDRCPLGHAKVPRPNQRWGWGRCLVCARSSQQRNRRETQCQ